MKGSIIGALLVVGIFAGGGVLQKAQQAYEAQDYPSSVEAYFDALSTYPEMGGTIRYNLAQSFLAMDSIRDAVRQFRLTMEGNDQVAGSLAANQLGIMLSDQGKEYDALDLFRRALILDPENEKARYNYEITSRFLKEQEEALKKQQIKNVDDMLDPPSESDEALIQSLIEGYTQPVPGTAPDMAQPVGIDTLPLPLARQVLEKMKRENPQFIQQLRKKPSNQPRKSKKPDW